MLGITHFHDQSFYASSERDIVLLIETGDEFVKNEHSSIPYHEKSFNRQAGTLYNVLHARRVEQNKGKFPTSALFLDTMIQKTKIIALYVLSLFIGTMRLFDFAERTKYKKPVKKAEIQEKRLFLKV